MRHLKKEKIAVEREGNIVKGKGENVEKGKSVEEKEIKEKVLNKRQRRRKVKSTD
jgi:hypothetical protein